MDAAGGRGARALAHGKDRSSLNAARHGFTGQTLILCHEEKEAYEFHVLACMEQYAPATHVETGLVQQYADLNWAPHQIAVQQTNLLSLINAITTKLMKEGDPEAVFAATAQPYKTLNTLGSMNSAAAAPPTPCSKPSPSFVPWPKLSVS